MIWLYRLSVNGIIVRPLMESEGNQKENEHGGSTRQLVKNRDGTHRRDGWLKGINGSRWKEMEYKWRIYK